MQSGSQIKIHIHTQNHSYAGTGAMMTDSKHVLFDNDAASGCYVLQLHLLLINANKSSCNGATPLGLKTTLHTQNCSPQESDLGLDPPCQARAAVSTCCCNSSCHRHSFIQQGASATDSDWHIGCGGVFNVCEGPLRNDHMHTPVACSHSSINQVFGPLPCRLSRQMQSMDASCLFSCQHSVLHCS